VKTKSFSLGLCKKEKPEDFGPCSYCQYFIVTRVQPKKLLSLNVHGNRHRVVVLNGLSLCRSIHLYLMPFFGVHYFIFLPVYLARAIFCFELCASRLTQIGTDEQGVFLLERGRL